MTSTGTRRESTSETDGEATHYVLGGGAVGAAVVRRLRNDDRRVELIDESYDDPELPGHRGDPADARVLEDAGVKEASTVVAATGSDARNLLIAQLVRCRFGVSDIVVRVNEPDRHDPLVAAGHEPVCATTALSEALVDTV